MGICVCKKFGEAVMVSTRIVDGKCQCPNGRCAVFPGRTDPDVANTITYTTKMSVHAHTNNTGGEPRQPLVSIFADESMRDLQSISFRPEFADAMCEAIQTAAKAALAGDEIEPISFTTDRGTN